MAGDAERLKPPTKKFLGRRGYNVRATPITII